MHISQISLGYSTRSKSLSLHEMCCPWDAAEVTADMPHVSPSRHWAPEPQRCGRSGQFCAHCFPSCVTLKNVDITEQLNRYKSAEEFNYFLFLSFFFF